MDEQRIVLKVEDPEFLKMRLDQFLARQISGLSRTRIKSLIEENKVRLNGMVNPSVSYKILLGDEIEIEVPPPEDTQINPQEIPLDIIYEDEDLLVINKPAGMVVHPAPGNYERTLVNALLFYCKGQLSGIGGVRRPGIVHRLDKDTSGLMVVAKNDEAHQGLSTQFEDRSIGRIYKAVVVGRPMPPLGTVDKNITRSQQNRQKQAISLEGGKPAITHYKYIESFAYKKIPLATLIECRLETGRTHQIRVHMASIGHPLLGDPLYGRGPKAQIINRMRGESPELSWLGTRQALHAAELYFIHPRTGEERHFKTPLPQDMEDLLSLLRKGNS